MLSISLKKTSALTNLHSTFYYEFEYVANDRAILYCYGKWVINNINLNALMNHKKRVPSLKQIQII